MTGIAVLCEFSDSFVLLIFWFSIQTSYVPPVFFFFLFNFILYECPNNYFKTIFISQMEMLYWCFWWFILFWIWDIITIECACKTSKLREKKSFLIEKHLIRIEAWFQVFFVQILFVCSLPFYYANYKRQCKDLLCLHLLFKIQELVTKNS